MEIGVQFSRSVVSDSLQPHGLQHVRPLCPSPAPGGFIREGSSLAGFIPFTLTGRCCLDIPRGRTGLKLFLVFSSSVQFSHSVMSNS